MRQDIINILETAGVRPTANRILVLKELITSHAPMGLIELEDKLCTLERSSILRVLSVLKEQSVIHAIEDGRGIVKYELCHGNNSCSVNDMHPHFYCEKCERVYCFETLSTPLVDIPEGFKMHTVNYMIKGICPTCATKLS